MKFCFISDTHNQLNKISEQIPENCHILFHCGDLTNLGSKNEIEKELNILSSLKGKFKVLCPGNHDWLAEKEPDLFRELCKDNNIICLLDEAVEIEGIKIYGSPWSPFFNWWAFNGARNEKEQAYYNKPLLKDIWAKIPNDTEILLTHGPAYNILDSTIDGRNVGCEDLFRRIQELKKLRIHASGHIHYSAGEKFFNGVHYINASICDEKYMPINKPIIVEL